MGWVDVRPRPLHPQERDPVPTEQEAGWASGSVWTGAENSAPPSGFDPRTVQPVGSSYTEYVIPAHGSSMYLHNLHAVRYVNDLANCGGSMWQCFRATSGVLLS